MKGTPVAVAIAAAAALAGCTTSEPQASASRPSSARSTTAKPDPNVPVLDAAAAKAAYRVFDKTASAVLSRAAGKSHDKSKIGTVLTGASKASSLYRTVLYTKLKEASKPMAFKTTLLKLWAGPKSPTGADEVITAAKVRFTGSQRTTQDELQVLRREPGSSTWKLRIGVQFDASGVPDDDVPVAKSLPTEAERTKVLGVVRNVLAYLDGGKEKGFVAGSALWNQASGTVGVTQKSKTVLWRDDELGSSDAVVIRRTSAGLLALVSTRRTLTSTTTDGRRFELDIHRLMFPGDHTSRITTTSAVNFALLVKTSGKPTVIGCEGTYVIP